MDNFIVTFFKLIGAMVIELTMTLSPWFPYILGAGALSITLLLVALILKIKFFKAVLQEEQVFLEVVPTDTTLQSQFSTEQLFKTLHEVGDHSSWIDNQIGNRRPISFEIVSTKEEGIRYIIKATPGTSELIIKNFRSFLPSVQVREVDDYIPSDISNKGWSIEEYRLTRHFVIPLRSQATLEEHDPIAYITGHMTQLSQEDIIALQVVATPVFSNTHSKVSGEASSIGRAIFKGKDISKRLDKPGFIFTIFSKTIGLGFKIILYILEFLVTGLSRFSGDNKTDYSWVLEGEKEKKFQDLSPEHQQLQADISKKIGSSLYEISLRLFVVSETQGEISQRIQGFHSALSPFNHNKQRLKTKSSMMRRLLYHIPFIQEKGSALKLLQFKHRSLSFFDNPILSSSEMAALYHFPYTDTTKTEDIIKVHSRELPAPRSLKQGRTLDVVFGTNTYGGVETEIGLTEDVRSRHIYMLGQTGSGKSSIIYQMAKHDIQKGRGVCVIDPHGDLAEDLLATVPIERKDDLIYFNPFDLDYPMIINLLELPDGLSESELELERELVAEGVISLFRKVFSKEEHVNAHRIEYLLRNTIHTAFSIPDRTIFTIYDILNNPVYREKVTKNLEDQNLRNFWKYEFGKAGNYQVVKMVSGVTAKVGRFLFSPTARRILEKPKSTINFDNILDEGKILICNLAEGKLGEDTSQLFGVMVTTKIQQAAMRRARERYEQRKPFYLFIDEFQTYATAAFSKLLSGSRKFGLYITVAEQSTSQQDDKRVTHIILANAGTVISFKTASPIDEDLILPQFDPHVKKGEILNLPRYRFYIKIGAISPEEAFSGHTFKIDTERDQNKIDRLITASRKNYCIKYERQKPESKSLSTLNGEQKPNGKPKPNGKKNQAQKEMKQETNMPVKSGLPEDGE